MPPLHSTNQTDSWSLSQAPALDTVAGRIYLDRNALAYMSQKLYGDTFNIVDRFLMPYKLLTKVEMEDNARFASYCKIKYLSNN